MNLWHRGKEFFSSLYHSISYNGSPPFEEPLPYTRLMQNHRVSIQFKGDKSPKDYTVKEFESLFEITYAKHLLFTSKKSYLLIKKMCKKRWDEGKISKRAEWIGVVYRNQIDTGDVKKVSIRFINDRIGFSLFLEEPVSQGDIIGEYTGIVRRCFPFFSLPNRYSFRYPLYRLMGGAFTIDAERYTNEISFINHSKNPNCEAVVSINHHLFHILIRAQKNLRKGEELFFDYGFPVENSF